MASEQDISSRLFMSCSVCKSSPLDKMIFISHVLGKRHRKNLKNRSKALRKDEMSRTLHVTGFKKDTPVELIVGAFYKYEVVNITPFLSYCFVELKSRQSVENCLKNEHYIKDKKLKVSLRHQSHVAAPPSPIKLNWQTDMMLKKIVTGAQAQWAAVEVLIRDIELKREHYEQREFLRQTLEDFFRPDFPVATACVFGSSANNLGFVGCDVDLYVHLGVDPWSEGSKAQKEAKASDLTWYLARKLKNLRRGYKVQAIARARVPIVKFEDAVTKLQVDLSFRNGMPVYNTQLICQYTRTHQLVRPYLMVIRYWAKLQDIAGGGQPTYLITNYGFTMLMLFYLMVRDQPLIPSVFELKSQCPMNMKREHTIEGWDCSFGQDVSDWARKRHDITVLELVCEFFEYFGKLDPRKWVISPLAGKLLDKGAVKERSRRELPSCMKYYCDQETDLQLDTALCLQDPFEHSYNITRGLHSGPLTEFQYKCRKAAEICDEIIRQETPLGDLFKEIYIDESILSSIQVSESPIPREVDITQEEIITLDDSDEISQEDVLQDEIEVLTVAVTPNLNATSSSNGGSSKVKERMEKDFLHETKAEEEIEICNTTDLSIVEIEHDDNTNDSSVEEISNGDVSIEIVSENGESGKKSHSLIKLPEDMPDKKLFKIPLDFSNTREFTITFDGCIYGGKDNMESPDDIGHAASSFIHFILQQCLKMEVNLQDSPTQVGKRKSQESQESMRSGKRMKNVDGNVVFVLPKYRKVSEYRCTTESQLWIGRKKASKTVPHELKANPLQYEMAVSQAQMCDFGSENGRNTVSRGGGLLDFVLTVWQMTEKPSHVLITGETLSVKNSRDR